jgi:hypothetical protein
MPRDSMCRAISLPSFSGKTWDIQLGSRTKKIKGMWRLCSISAISTPINPPPTTTADVMPSV